MPADYIMRKDLPCAYLEAQQPRALPPATRLMPEGSEGWVLRALGFPFFARQKRREILATPMPSARWTHLSKPRTFLMASKTVVSALW
jgi:hypothetical protein